MSERAHTPTCEVNRGGDHGPCSCGRDAEARRERLASMSGEQMVALMLAYGHAREAGRLDTATDDGVALRDAIRSLARQRDEMKAHIQAEVDGCPDCQGRGVLPCLNCTMEGTGRKCSHGTISCRRCADGRAALEVR